MNRAKYLFVIFIGTLVYVSLSLTVGQNSFRCYKQLEEQKRIVSKRKNDIQNMNTELTLELTALKNDKAVIAAYARKLDYVAEGEKLVKITGLKPVQNVLFETGSIIRHAEPEFVSEELCKVVGVLTGLVVLLLMLIYDYKNGNFTKNTKETYMAGVPIYDLQQI